MLFAASTSAVTLTGEMPLWWRGGLECCKHCLRGATTGSMRITLIRTHCVRALSLPLSLPPWHAYFCSGPPRDALALSGPLPGPAPSGASSDVWYDCSAEEGIVDPVFGFSGVFSDPPVVTKNRWFGSPSPCAPGVLARSAKPMCAHSHSGQVVHKTIHYNGTMTLPTVAADFHQVAQPEKGEDGGLHIPIPFLARACAAESCEGCSGSYAWFACMQVARVHSNKYTHMRMVKYAHAQALHPPGQSPAMNTLCSCLMSAHGLVCVCARACA